MKELSNAYLIKEAEKEKKIYEKDNKNIILKLLVHQENLHPPLLGENDVKFTLSPKIKQ